MVNCIEGNGTFQRTHDPEIEKSCSLECSSAACKHSPADPSATVCSDTLHVYDVCFSQCTALYYFQLMSVST